jgi:hypothetical protein
MCAPTSPRIMPAIPATMSAMPKEDARTLRLQYAKRQVVRARDGPEADRPLRVANVTPETKDKP